MGRRSLAPYGGIGVAVGLAGTALVIVVVILPHKAHVEHHEAPSWA
jgi:hypothetical protein